MTTNKTLMAALAATVCGWSGGVGAQVSYKDMADALHAVMESDRTVYTRMVVNRLQNEEKVIKATEHFKDDKSLPLPARIVAAAAVLIPIGVLLGMPLPGGMRLLAERRRDLIAWGWGMNGAFSVVGATLAVFLAMNWGFSATLLIGAAVYGAAAQTLRTR